MDALKKIGEVLGGDLVRNLFFKSLAYGIIFSLIMTYIIGAIEGVFHPQTSFPYFTLASGSAPYWIAILFVTFALLFAILGYVSQINTRDDLLTPLGGKLVLQFKISKSDIFKDQEINIITTAFSFDGAARKLVYFYDTQLELKAPIDKITKIDFPFLGVLTIKFEEDETVREMEGHWYDINNGVYNLARRMDHLTGLPELTKAVENGAVTFGGAIEFKRVEVPHGTPVAAD